MLFDPLRVAAATAAVLLASALPAAFAQHAHHSKRATAELTDPPGTHGMLLFGTAALYASHLPMYHSPHDYQVLLQLEFSSPAQTAYTTSRQQFAQETVYTLDPEKFVLPEMVGHPRPFKADVYRGHFERGGTCIAKSATVRIRRVVYFRRLDPSEAAVPLPAYVLFGNAQEQFLAHRIGGRPSHDHVLRVAAPGAVAKLGRRSYLPWQADSVFMFPLTTPQILGGKAGKRLLPLHVLRSLYFETDDLR
jgi:hypothetical protein